MPLFAENMQNSMQAVQNVWQVTKTGDNKLKIIYYTPLNFMVWG